ncbi:LysR family transcriptional regulator [Azospirillum sp. RWY-5-1]|uniref:LysR family transcriptional regulator n=1 Tax=Azospirillum oleiclasticum TaxID=2735135 RepID=A0ABX2T3Z7_9PROT|nr:LysR family transcriptional regulator [Azospirillum oleiclasticum]NYZ11828.1 LysR family transcriptional regulator [Azospirillum oleiclasticum]NYZ18988.1 LysR family transcriptional regulator [Azospirillum oleiclasticum]
MDNRAGEMQVFLRVVEAGSFSEAARQLLMTPSTVSKLIGRIEARLGVRLLERSTRRLSLTGEGRIYYERSQNLLGELDAIERDLTQGAASITGTVRVSASVGLGMVAIEPLLPAFWQEFPNIALDLSISDEVVDLYLDRTDVAFRVGKLANSSLTAIRLGSAPRKIVASPDYLRRRGVPKTAADLAHHACLSLNFRRSAPVWLLHEAGQVFDGRVSGPLSANNGETVRRMALAGMGLARIGEFHIREDLASGALVEVLAEVVAVDREDVHAVYLGGDHMPRRVRILLDFMVPRLRAFLGETKARDNG